MGKLFKFGTALGLALWAGACVTRVEKTLDALDASKTETADALVVQVTNGSQLHPPSDVVRGSGEGATTAIGAYFRGVVGAGREGFLVALLLAPIALPVSAAVGAGAAHSEKEVDAAVAAVNAVARDKQLWSSLDQRFLNALGDAEKSRWDCVEAASRTTARPCRGRRSVARLIFRTHFSLRSEGRYDPDIYFSGSVEASAHMEDADTGAMAAVVPKAVWAYREKLGAFFDLTKDDAAMLRRMLGHVLDRFARRIADDLYLAPRAATVTIEKGSSGQPSAEIPEKIVVRTD